MSEDRRRHLLAMPAARDGQALPLAIGGIAVVLAVAMALVAIAGALTGKARAQRAADLSAVSAARSMRDDLPRLLSPATLPGGIPNPAHLSKRRYLARARAAARQAALTNGVRHLQITFPDRVSFAPLRARTVVSAEVGRGRGGSRTEVSAVAEAMAPPEAGAGAPAMASGGGYSGPLVYRQGEGMRPDVAVAFDRMSAAAARAGLDLIVNSGFRSDAEQAALFAAHPDPRWVAPPGHSLHRCATELDLGPSAAYGWLAGHAHRSGFTKRYSWEPWHFGFDGGPQPCSAAGNSVLGPGDDGAAGGGSGLPDFVPARFRGPLLDSAARWNVSAALLAAQLMAESNFNPLAQSGVGAQGIAQFIPSTAAAYGLRNPFDAEAAIDAQAHLMSDLLRRFGSFALALAAYNAGPAGVAACRCVPEIPETQAYVSRILGLLGGAGALLVPPFEVRLIE
jgi:Transglycosylase SLT domain/D-alanyl-D-alanine carboxypeptidase